MRILFVYIPGITVKLCFSDILPHYFVFLSLVAPSGEKYCRSSWSCAPAERDRMLMAAASVIAPPNPLIFWYFWSGTMVNLRPEGDA